MLNLTNILLFHLDKFVHRILIMELNSNVEYILNRIYHMNILLHNNESKLIYFRLFLLTNLYELYPNNKMLEDMDNNHMNYFLVHNKLYLLDKQICYL